MTKAALRAVRYRARRDTSDSQRASRHDGGPGVARDFVEQFISHYLRQCGYLGAKGRVQFKACDFVAVRAEGQRTAREGPRVRGCKV